MTTALARELTQGIKNEVEDLSAVFKKMAKFKPDPNPIEVMPERAEPVCRKEAAVKAGEVFFPDFQDAKASSITVSYDLLDYAEAASIQKGFPADFDPFAEEAA